MKETKKTPGSDAGGKPITEKVSAKPGEMSSTKKEKCPHEDSHDGMPCGYCGQSTNSTKVPLGNIAEQRQTTNRVKAAEGPGTERLLNDMPRIEDYIKDLAKRRSGKMWMIAERIKNLFLKGGITTSPMKGQITDEAASIGLTFGQGEYTDATGKRREHRWKITIENIDCIPEGVCPRCNGEMETEILDDNKRRVACGECDYELSSFCGVEVDDAS